jgi:hypothetical protein
MVVRLGRRCGLRSKSSKPTTDGTDKPFCSAGWELAKPVFDEGSIRRTSGYGMLELRAGQPLRETPCCEQVRLSLNDLLVDKVLECAIDATADAIPSAIAG